MLPLRHGTDADFSAVRELLETADYREPALCERLGLAELGDFRSYGEGRRTGLEVETSQDLLVRIFMDGLAVHESAVHELLPAEGLRALRNLGLLDRHPDAPDRYAASVLLHPVGPLYVASDLTTEAPGLQPADSLEPPDFVFSAGNSLTRTFLGQIPEARCGRFLELCAGTGIAALGAARWADEVWAADITERCTGFIAFNARLNGVHNLIAVRGDMYEPVEGRVFDRIAVHPPYVPAEETRMIYRDGGDDGETLVRRAVAGLARHLAPGGTFHMTCMSTDREEGPLEERYRRMLGEGEGEFDVLLVTHTEWAVAEYYSRLAASGRIDYATAQRRIEQFHGYGARSVVYASVVIQRHDEPRPAFTVRRERTGSSAGAETDWLLRWTTTLAATDVLPALLESRPRLSPHARLQVEHRVEAGEWKVDASRVRMELPFVRTVELSMNAATLLTLCDGEHTVREILRRLKDGGAMGEEVPELSFAEWVRELVTEGVLLVDTIPRLQQHEAGAHSRLIG